MSVGRLRKTGNYAPQGSGRKMVLYAPGVYNRYTAYFYYSLGSGVSGQQYYAEGI